MKIIVQLTLLVLIFTSCTTNKETKYSFFIAGHTYGKPTPDGAKELYKPFKAKFDFINTQPNLKFGVLLGDVVRYPTSWPNVTEELKLLSMPIHIARGNHDGALEPFEKMFGPSYKKFQIDNDLFIILDPNIDQWNISNKQLAFLKKTLEEDAKDATNIFIFMHQLIWWDKEKRNFKRPRPNSTKGRANTVNYWNTIKPLLTNTNKPVYLMAGDVGAFYLPEDKSALAYSLQEKENISYITTGMGGGVHDNFIIVDINTDNSVSYRLIHLNGADINGLGSLD